MDLAGRCSSPAKAASGRRDSRWRSLEVAPKACPLHKEGADEIVEIPEIEYKLRVIGDAVVWESGVEPSQPLLRVKDVAAGIAELTKPFELPKPEGLP